MVDRFHNPDAPPRHLPFDAKFGGFQGSNLKGVRQPLPYLKSLGAGAIWITPVLQNCQWQDGTYHGYGIQNFIRIDPRFGTEQDLQDLVDAAPDDPHRFDPQVSIGVGGLFALLGIPVLYYGTEQGRHGAGDSDQNVREALWGKPDAFDTNHPLYKAIQQQIATVRARQPALCYDRQYFRGVSGSGAEFGISTAAPGIVAFSRILNDQEVVILANTFINTPFSGFVIVDFGLNPDGSAMQILYSNQGATATPPGPVTTKALNTVIIHEFDGSITHGPLRVLPFALKPMEIQILGQKA